MHGQAGRRRKAGETGSGAPACLHTPVVLLHQGRAVPVRTQPQPGGRGVIGRAGLTVPHATPHRATSHHATSHRPHTTTPHHTTRHRSAPVHRSTAPQSGGLPQPTPHCHSLSTLPRPGPHTRQASGRRPLATPPHQLYIASLGVSVPRMKTMTGSALEGSGVMNSADREVVTVPVLKGTWRRGAGGGAARGVQEVRRAAGAAGSKAGRRRRRRAAALAPRASPTSLRQAPPPLDALPPCAARRAQQGHTRHPRRHLECSNLKGCYVPRGAPRPGTAHPPLPVPPSPPISALTPRYAPQTLSSPAPPAPDTPQTPPAPSPAAPPPPVLPGTARRT